MRVDTAATVEAWVDLCQRLGVTALPDLLRSRGENLLARWGEPHRHYHNRHHLTFVLDALTTLAGDAGAALPTAQRRFVQASADHARMAAWYHDAVYDPARSDNEERSAALASTQLAGLGVRPAIVGEVERLVLLTRTHDPGEDDLAGQLVCDADLGILAAPPDVYDAYAARVRAEYAHVPDPEFRAGRCALLSALANRESLFRTRHGEVEWEQPARANLARELARLRER